MWNYMYWNIEVEMCKEMKNQEDQLEISLVLWGEEARNK